MIAEIDRSPRGFKDILDCCCFAENISSLFIGDRKSLDEKLETAIDACESFDKWIQFANQLDNAAIDALMENVSKNVSFGYSYANPFFDILRESKKWILFEIIFVLRNSDSIDKNFNVISIPGIFEGTLSIGIFRDSETGYIVCFGPLWISDEIISTPDHFARIESELTKVSELLNFKSKQQLSQSRLSRHLRHRGLISLKDLQDRASTIRRAIQMTLSTRIPDNFYNSEVYFITLVHLIILRFYMKNSPSTFFRKTTEYTWEFGDQILKCIEKKSPNRNKYFVRIFVRGSDKSYSVIEKHEKNFKTNFVPENFSIFSSYIDSFITNRNSYFLERVMLLRLWFQAAYNISPAGDKSRPALDDLARRIRQTFSLDACNIYKLEPLSERELVRIGGSYNLSLVPGSFSSRNQKLMLDSAVENTRLSSVCYRSIDQNRTEFWQDIPRDKILLDEQEPSWKSVLAIPLLSRGQIWGAIEVKSEQVGQLFRDFEKWLEEFARVFMPTIGDRWLVHHNNNMSSAAIKASSSTERKYKALANEMGHLFNADSISFYLRNPVNEQSLVRIFCKGRKIEQTDREICLKKDKSSTGWCFNANKVWYRGEIGKGIFADEWLKHPENKWLLDNGHRYIAVIPIYSSSRKPLGSLTITSKGCLPFSNQMDDLVGIVSREFASMIEEIWVSERNHTSRRKMDAHSIKTRIPRTINSLDKVIEVLSPIMRSESMGAELRQLQSILEIARASNHINVEKVAPNADNTISQIIQLMEPVTNILTGRTENNFRKAIDDLRDSAEALRRAAIRVAGGKDLDDPNETDPSQWRGTWSDFRSELIYCLKTLEEDSEELEFELPTIWEVPHDIKIRIPGIIFSEILSNLIDNAVKYDFAESSSVAISAYFDPNKTTCEVQISNLAPGIKKDLIRQFGKVRGDDIRAPYAKKKDKAGSGLGLYYAHKMATRWGFTIKYTCNNHRKSNRGLVRHQVRLFFPSNLINTPE